MLLGAPEPLPVLSTALSTLSGSCTCNRALAYNFTGYNVDWEPASGNITGQDAADYAAFLDTFARAMHAVGKTVSVDVATWYDREVEWGWDGGGGCL